MIYFFFEIIDFQRRFSTFMAEFFMNCTWTQNVSGSCDQILDNWHTDDTSKMFISLGVFQIVFVRIILIFTYLKNCASCSHHFVFLFSSYYFPEKGGNYNQPGIFTIET